MNVGEEKENKVRKRGRQTVRDLTTGNKQVAGEEVDGGLGNCVMGIREEGTGCNEPWELCATNESLNSTAEANDTLYVN